MRNKNLKENLFLRYIALPFRGLVKFLSPTLYVKLQYKYITHHKLNLKNPTRYTEKLQHLRLYEYPNNDLVKKCASRVEVRDYVSSLGLSKCLIPCLGIYNKFDDIDFDKLPSQFVMKCSHASGFNYIVKDKNSIDKKLLKKKFDKWLKTNYGKKTIELHYAKIKPQIIIEKYIGDKSSLPKEYKIHVFNGVAKYLYVVTGRGVDIRYNNYYIDWTPFDGAQFNGWKKTDYALEKPANYEKMIEFAELLAKPFPFVRVDLYNINGVIYFGEMTFTPAKGTLILDDDNVDYEISKWLKIN